MTKIYKSIFSFLVTVVICLSTEETHAAVRSCKALLAKIRNDLEMNNRLPSISLTATSRAPWFYQKESLNPLFAHVDQMKSSEVELVYAGKHGLVILVRNEVYLLDSDFINKKNRSSTLIAKVLRIDREDPSNHERLAMYLKPMTALESISFAVDVPLFLGPPFAIYYSAKRNTLNAINFELPIEKISALRTKLQSDQTIQLEAADFEGASAYDTRVFRGGVNRAPALSIPAGLAALVHLVILLRQLQ